MFRTFEEKRRGRLASEYGERWNPVPGGLRVALVYPNTYPVGMSNLGFQTIYHLLNLRSDISCERVFLPDREEREKTGNVRELYRSLESGSLLASFDVLAFSVSFELDYVHLAEILVGGAVPPLREERRPGRDPQVWIGGVAVTLNPEPIADFADLIFVGEGEELLPEVLDRIAGVSASSFPPTDEIFPVLRNLPGVYIPSAYTFNFDSYGRISRVEPSPGFPERISRRRITDLSRFPTVSRILTPETELNDMFLIELDRGCGRHCRFCAAGYLYRPPRFRPLSAVLESVRAGLTLSDRIGLVGTAVSDYPYMEGLLKSLRRQGAGISVSSLRADSLTPTLLDALVESGHKTVTLAPEGGSRRMRDRMNKDLTEETILGAAKRVFAAGVLNLKLYFMVGLPFEEESDIHAIVELVRKMKKVQLDEGKPRGRIGRITVSLNCFVPKPATPFQWFPMNKKDALTNKIGYIKKNLRREGNITVIHDLPKWAIIQGMFARGDRRLSALILSVVRDRGNWSRVLRRDPLGAGDWPFRPREREEIFPWDIVGEGCRRDYLFREYERANTGSYTPPCPEDLRCGRCGVCRGPEETEAEE
ncbi:MAG: radical SAM protein [Deltaproteobacteria bacterium]|nr:radical SAM protein [Deltaproteobacteria bacterium]